MYTGEDGEKLNYDTKHVNKRCIYFEMQADDTKRAIGFYTKIFGWKFEKAFGLQVGY